MKNNNNNNITGLNPEYTLLCIWPLTILDIIWNARNRNVNFSYNKDILTPVI